MKTSKVEDEESDALKIQKGQFSLGDDVGSLIAFESSDDMMAQIGLGPSLMLMVMKALVQVGLLMFCVGLFLVVIYAYNQWPEITHLHELVGISRPFISTFVSSLTLGNLGTSTQVSCESRNIGEYLNSYRINQYIQTNSTLQISCKNGQTVRHMLNYQYSPEKTCAQIKNEPFGDHYEKHSIVKNLLPFGAPKASHDKAKEALRAPQNLYYGSSLSLFLNFSRNETYLPVKHHYQAEVKDGQLYLGPHLYVYQ